MFNDAGRINIYLPHMKTRFLPMKENKALLIELITLKENMFHATKDDKKA